MRKLYVVLAGSIFLAAPVQAASEKDYLGSWNITIQDPTSTFNACWWKIEDGGQGLGGSILWRWASPGAITKAEVVDGELLVTRGRGEKAMMCRVKLEGGILRGTVQYPDGKTFPIEGKKAPRLTRKVQKWGKPISLTGETGLAGWKIRKPGAPLQGWEIRDGVLSCTRPGGERDLISKQKFQDFKLHLEFRMDGSNSGLYLRGRYEIQLAGDFGRKASKHGTGAVYGRLQPRLNASRKKSDWQTMEVTLIGRQLTVVLNGETIHENAVIEGITGGALDSEEEKPGPILFQGDHDKVSLRNIVITPAE